MKHTLLSFAIVIAGFCMLPAIAHSQQSTKSVGDNNLYAFATIGQASHDANLDSAVSIGSLSLTRSTDDEGTAITLGVGLQQSDKIAFEFYGGTVDGFGSTTTLTATNAVVDGNTINGSLSLKEDISSKLIGANVVFSSQLRVIDDQSDTGQKLSFAGNFGLISYKIEDELTLYGSGTVNGSSYTISSPVILKIKESGTAPLIGAKFNYAVNDDLEFRFGVDYVAGIGGGDLAEADLTIYNIGVSLRF